MAPQVGCFTRHCNCVSHACGNLLITSGTHILLQRFVWLNTTRLNLAVQVIPNISSHGGYPRNAHATSTVATQRAIPTNHTSLLRATCLRVGLNPIRSVSLHNRRSARTLGEYRGVNAPHHHCHHSCGVVFWLWRTCIGERRNDHDHRSARCLRQHNLDQH